MRSGILRGGIRLQGTCSVTCLPPGVAAPLGCTQRHLNSHPTGSAAYCIGSSHRGCQNCLGCFWVAVMSVVPLTSPDGVERPPLPEGANKVSNGLPKGCPWWDHVLKFAFFRNAQFTTSIGPKLSFTFHEFQLVLTKRMPIRTKRMPIRTKRILKEQRRRMADHGAMLRHSLRQWWPLLWSLLSYDGTSFISCIYSFNKWCVAPIQNLYSYFAAFSFFFLVYLRHQQNGES